MADKDSSDEEDVFECGRCKEKFTDMTIFMHHKREKSCHKAKKQKEITKDTAQELGDVLNRILNSNPDGHEVSPIRDQGEVSTTTTGVNISPTISELFTSKAGDKDIDPEHISLDILRSLTHTSRQEHSSTSTDSVTCQQWFPEPQILENQLQEKPHIDASREEQAELQEKPKPKVEADNEPHQTTSDASSNLPVEKPSRRTHPQYSCSVCNLKFLSKFKLEQHNTSRKHRNTVKKQNTDNAQTSAPKRRPGRPSKKGSCTLCSVSTDSLKDLKRHLKEKHKGAFGKENSGNGVKRAIPDQAKNLCGECGSFVATGSLKRHERRCANKKRYECPLCRHKSREKTDFNGHIENHKVWIEVDKAVVPWDGTAPCAITRNEDQQILNSEKEKIAEVSDDADKDEGITLSASDLAVLGLMPKPKFSTVEECLNAIASGLKGTYDEQIRKEMQNENMGVSENPDSAESSSVKLNSKQLKCKECKKWFSRRNLSKHMYDVHSMTKQFQCRDVDCLQVFTDMDMFTSHVTSHSNKLMFQCGCRQCLPNKSAVEEEYAEEMRKWKMRKYYAQLSFKCKLCWMKFPTESKLRKHQQSNSHNHQCDECGKVMVSKRQLRLHKESHQDQRGYLCDMCGSGFKTDRDLKRHIASHGSEKPFPCNDCGKAFLFKNKLTRHVNTVHATHKPYACEYEGCRKSFARKDKLIDHQNTHKSPLHNCKFCSKTFYRKDVMKEHQIQAHTKEFPYFCKMCEKGFLRPKTLMNHQANEHNTSVSPTTLDKLLKASASVQQRARNTPISAAASLAGYVIYEHQNIASVLQGASDNDSRSLQLQSMALASSATSEAPSSGNLSYQMTDITGAGGSNLGYQVTGGSLPDETNALQVSLSEALSEEGVLVIA